MRSLIAAIGLTLAASSSVLAALPPQYQRQAELRAIIDDENVVDAFGFDGIAAVELNGTDHYIVRGGGCMLDVMIEDVPNTHGAGWVGPRDFKLVLGEKVCGGAQ